MPEEEDEQDILGTLEKRAFTNWINKVLKQHSPPYLVTDLFKDLRSGTVLLALIEQLSGTKLNYATGANIKITDSIDNVELAIKTLQDQGIQIGTINPNDIFEGTPKVILSLIWNIILQYEIKNQDPDIWEELVKRKKLYQEMRRTSNELKSTMSTISSSASNNDPAKLESSSDHNNNNNAQYMSPQFLALGFPKQILEEWCNKYIDSSFNVEASNYTRSQREEIVLLTSLVDLIDRRLKSRPTLGEPSPSGDVLTSPPLGPFERNPIFDWEKAKRAYEGIGRKYSMPTINLELLKSKYDERALIHYLIHYFQSYLNSDKAKLDFKPKPNEASKDDLGKLLFDLKRGVSNIINQIDTSIPYLAQQEFVIWCKLITQNSYLFEKLRVIYERQKSIKIAHEVWKNVDGKWANMDLIKTKLTTLLNDILFKDIFELYTITKIVNERQKEVLKSYGSSEDLSKETELNAKRPSKSSANQSSPPGSLKLPKDIEPPHLKSPAGSFSFLNKLIPTAPTASVADKIDNVKSVIRIDSRKLSRVYQILLMFTEVKDLLNVFNKVLDRNLGLNNTVISTSVKSNDFASIGSDTTVKPDANLNENLQALLRNLKKLVKDHDQSILLSSSEHIDKSFLDQMGDLQHEIDDIQTINNAFDIYDRDYLLANEWLNTIHSSQQPVSLEDIKSHEDLFNSVDKYGSILISNALPNQCPNLRSQFQRVMNEWIELKTLVDKFDQQKHPNKQWERRVNETVTFRDNEAGGRVLKTYEETDKSANGGPLKMAKKLENKYEDKMNDKEITIKTIKERISFKPVLIQSGNNHHPSENPEVYLYQNAFKPAYDKVLAPKIKEFRINQDDPIKRGETLSSYILLLKEFEGEALKNVEKLIATTTTTKLPSSSSNNNNEANLKLKIYLDTKCENIRNGIELLNVPDGKDAAPLPSKVQLLPAKLAEWSRFLNDTSRVNRMADLNFMRKTRDSYQTLLTQIALPYGNTLNRLIDICNSLSQLFVTYDGEGQDLVNSAFLERETRALLDEYQKNIKRSNEFGDFVNRYVALLEKYYNDCAVVYLYVKEVEEILNKSLALSGHQDGGGQEESFSSTSKKNLKKFSIKLDDNVLTDLESDYRNLVIMIPAATHSTLTSTSATTYELLKAKTWKVIQDWELCKFKVNLLTAVNDYKVHEDRLDQLLGRLRAELDFQTQCLASGKYEIDSIRKRYSGSFFPKGTVTLIEDDLSRMKAYHDVVITQMENITANGSLSSPVLPLDIIGVDTLENYNHHHPSQHDSSWADKDLGQDITKDPYTCNCLSEILFGHHGSDTAHDTAASPATITSLDFLAPFLTYDLSAKREEWELLRSQVSEFGDRLTIALTRRGSFTSRITSINESLKEMERDTNRILDVIQTNFSTKTRPPELIENDTVYVKINNELFGKLPSLESEWEDLKSLLSSTAYLENVPKSMIATDTHNLENLCDNLSELKQFLRDLHDKYLNIRQKYQEESNTKRAAAPPLNPPLVTDINWEYSEEDGKRDAEEPHSAPDLIPLNEKTVITQTLSPQPASIKTTEIFESLGKNLRDDLNLSKRVKLNLNSFDLMKIPVDETHKIVDDTPAHSHPLPNIAISEHPEMRSYEDLLNLIHNQDDVPPVKVYPSSFLPDIRSAWNGVQTQQSRPIERPLVTEKDTSIIINPALKPFMELDDARPMGSQKFWGNLEQLPEYIIDRGPKEVVSRVKRDKNAMENEEEEIPPPSSSLNEGPKTVKTAQKHMELVVASTSQMVPLINQKGGKSSVPMVSSPKSQALGSDVVKDDQVEKELELFEDNTFHDTDYLGLGTLEKPIFIDYSKVQPDSLQPIIPPTKISGPKLQLDEKLDIIHPPLEINIGESTPAPIPAPQAPKILKKSRKTEKLSPPGVMNAAGDESTDGMPPTTTIPSTTTSEHRVKFVIPEGLDDGETTRTKSPLQTSISQPNVIRRPSQAEGYEEKKQETDSVENTDPFANFYDQYGEPEKHILDENQTSTTTPTTTTTTAVSTENTHILDENQTSTTTPTPTTTTAVSTENAKTPLDEDSIGETDESEESGPKTDEVGEESGKPTGEISIPKKKADEAAVPAALVDIERDDAKDVYDELISKSLPPFSIPRRSRDRDINTANKESDKKKPKEMGEDLTQENLPVIHPQIILEEDKENLSLISANNKPSSLLSGDHNRDKITKKDNQTTNYVSPHLVSDTRNIVDSTTTSNKPPSSEVESITHPQIILMEEGDKPALQQSKKQHEEEELSLDKNEIPSLPHVPSHISKTTIKKEDITTNNVPSKSVSETRNIKDFPSSNKQPSEDEEPIKHPEIILIGEGESQALKTEHERLPLDEISKKKVKSSIVTTPLPIKKTAEEEDITTNNVPSESVSETRNIEDSLDSPSLNKSLPEDEESIKHPQMILMEEGVNPVFDKEKPLDEISKKKVKSSIVTTPLPIKKTAEEEDITTNNVPSESVSETRNIEDSLDSPSSNISLPEDEESIKHPQMILMEEGVNPVFDKEKPLDEISKKMDKSSIATTPLPIKKTAKEEDVTTNNVPSKSVSETPNIEDSLDSPSSTKSPPEDEESIKHPQMILMEEGVNPVFHKEKELPVDQISKKKGESLKTQDERLPLDEISKKKDKSSIVTTPLPIKNTVKEEDNVPSESVSKTRNIKDPLDSPSPSSNKQPSEDEESIQHPQMILMEEGVNPVFHKDKELPVDEISKKKRESSKKVGTDKKQVAAKDFEDSLPKTTTPDLAHITPEEKKRPVKIKSVTPATTAETGVRDEEILPESPTDSTTPPSSAFSANRKFDIPETGYGLIDTDEDATTAPTANLQPLIDSEFDTTATTDEPSSSSSLAATELVSKKPKEMSSSSLFQISPNIIRRPSQLAPKDADVNALGAPSTSADQDPFESFYEQFGEPDDEKLLENSSENLSNYSIGQDVAGSFKPSKDTTEKDGREPAVTLKPKTSKPEIISDILPPDQKDHKLPPHITGKKDQKTEMTPTVQPVYSTNTTPELVKTQQNLQQQTDSVKEEGQLKSKKKAHFPSNLPTEPTGATNTSTTAADFHPDGIAGAVKEVHSDQDDSPFFSPPVTTTAVSATAPKVIRTYSQKDSPHHTQKRLDDPFEIFYDQYIVAAPYGKGTNGSEKKHLPESTSRLENQLSSITPPESSSDNMPTIVNYLNAHSGDHIKNYRENSNPNPSPLVQNKPGILTFSEIKQAQLANNEMPHILDEITNHVFNNKDGLENESRPLPPARTESKRKGGPQFNINSDDNDLSIASKHPAGNIHQVGSPTSSSALRAHKDKSLGGHDLFFDGVPVPPELDGSPISVLSQKVDGLHHHHRGNQDNSDSTIIKSNIASESSMIDELNFLIDHKDDRNSKMKSKAPQELPEKFEEVSNIPQNTDLDEEVDIKAVANIRKDLQIPLKLNGNFKIIPKPAEFSGLETKPERDIHQESWKDIVTPHHGPIGKKHFLHESNINHDISKSSNNTKKPEIDTYSIFKHDRNKMSPRNISPGHHQVNKVNDTALTVEEYENSLNIHERPTTKKKILLPRRHEISEEKLPSGVKSTPGPHPHHHHHRRQVDLNKRDKDIGLQFNAASASEFTETSGPNNIYFDTTNSRPEMKEDRVRDLHDGEGDGKHHFEYFNHNEGSRFNYNTHPIADGKGKEKSSINEPISLVGRDNTFVSPSSPQHDHFEYYGGENVVSPSFSPMSGFDSPDAFTKSNLSLDSGYHHSEYNIPLHFVSEQPKKNQHHLHSKNVLLTEDNFDYNNYPSKDDRNLKTNTKIHVPEALTTQEYEEQIISNSSEPHKAVAHSKEMNVGEVVEFFPKHGGDLPLQFQNLNAKQMKKARLNDLDLEERAVENLQNIQEESLYEAGKLREVGNTTNSRDSFNDFPSSTKRIQITALKPSVEVLQRGRELKKSNEIIVVKQRSASPSPTLSIKVNKIQTNNPPKSISAITMERGSSKILFEQPHEIRPGTDDFEIIHHHKKQHAKPSLPKHSNIIQTTYDEVPLEFYSHKDDRNLKKGKIHVSDTMLVEEFENSIHFSTDERTLNLTEYQNSRDNFINLDPKELKKARMQDLDVEERRVEKLQDIEDDGIVEVLERSHLKLSNLSDLKFKRSDLRVDISPSDIYEITKEAEEAANLSKYNDSERVVSRTPTPNATSFPDRSSSFSCVKCNKNNLGSFLGLTDKLPVKNLYTSDSFNQVITDESTAKIADAHKPPPFQGKPGSENFEDFINVKEHDPQHFTANTELSRPTIKSPHSLAARYQTAPEDTFDYPNKDDRNVKIAKIHVPEALTTQEYEQIVAQSDNKQRNIGVVEPFPNHGGPLKFDNLNAKQMKKARLDDLDKVERIVENLQNIQEDRLHKAVKPQQDGNTTNFSDSLNDLRSSTERKQIKALKPSELFQRESEHKKPEMTVIKQRSASPLPTSSSIKVNKIQTNNSPKSTSAVKMEGEASKVLFEKPHEIRPGTEDFEIIHHHKKQHARPSLPKRSNIIQTSDEVPLDFYSHKDDRNLKKGKIHIPDTMSVEEFENSIPPPTSESTHPPVLNFTEYHRSSPQNFVNLDPKELKKARIHDLNLEEVRVQKLQDIEDDGIVEVLKRSNLKLTDLSDLKFKGLDFREISPADIYECTKEAANLAESNNSEIVLPIIPSPKASSPLRSSSFSHVKYNKSDQGSFLGLTDKATSTDNIAHLHKSLGKPGKLEDDLIKIKQVKPPHVIARTKLSQPTTTILRPMDVRNETTPSTFFEGTEDDTFDYYYPNKDDRNLKTITKIHVPEALTTQEYEQIIAKSSSTSHNVAKHDETNVGIVDTVSGHGPFEFDNLTAKQMKKSRLDHLELEERVVENLQNILIERETPIKTAVKQRSASPSPPSSLKVKKKTTQNSPKSLAVNMGQYERIKSEALNVPIEISRKTGPGMEDFEVTKRIPVKLLLPNHLITPTSDEVPFDFYAHKDDRNLKKDKIHIPNTLTVEEFENSIPSTHESTHLRALNFTERRRSRDNFVNLDPKELKKARMHDLDVEERKVEKLQDIEDDGIVKVLERSNLKLTDLSDLKFKGLDFREISPADIYEITKEAEEAANLAESNDHENIQLPKIQSTKVISPHRSRSFSYVQCNKNDQGSFLGLLAHKPTRNRFNSDSMDQVITKSPHKITHSSPFQGKSSSGTFDNFTKVKRHTDLSEPTPHLIFQTSTLPSFEGTENAPDYYPSKDDRNVKITKIHVPDALTTQEYERQIISKSKEPRGVAKQHKERNIGLSESVSSYGPLQFENLNAKQLKKARLEDLDMEERLVENLQDIQSDGDLFNKNNVSKVLNEVSSEFKGKKLNTTTLHGGQDEINNNKQRSKIMTISSSPHKTRPKSPAGVSSVGNSVTLTNSTFVPRQHPQLASQIDIPAAISTPSVRVGFDLTKNETFPDFFHRTTNLPATFTIPTDDVTYDEGSSFKYEYISPIILYSPPHESCTIESFNSAKPNLPSSNVPEKIAISSSEKHENKATDPRLIHIPLHKLHEAEVCPKPEKNAEKDHGPRDTSLSFKYNKNEDQKSSKPKTITSSHEFATNHQNNDIYCKRVDDPRTVKTPQSLVHHPGIDNLSKSNNITVEVGQQQQKPSQKQFENSSDLPTHKVTQMTDQVKDVVVPSKLTHEILNNAQTFLQSFNYPSQNSPSKDSLVSSPSSLTSSNNDNNTSLQSRGNTVQASVMQIKKNFDKIKNLQDIRVIRDQVENLVSQLNTHLEPLKREKERLASSRSEIKPGKERAKLDEMISLFTDYLTYLSKIDTNLNTVTAFFQNFEAQTDEIDKWLQDTNRLMDDPTKPAKDKIALLPKLERQKNSYTSLMDDSAHACSRVLEPNTELSKTLLTSMSRIKEDLGRMEDKFKSTIDSCGKLKKFEDETIKAITKIEKSLKESNDLWKSRIPTAIKAVVIDKPIKSNKAFSKDLKQLIDLLQKADQSIDIPVNLLKELTVKSEKSPENKELTQRFKGKIDELSGEVDKINQMRSISVNDLTQKLREIFLKEQDAILSKIDAFNNNLTSSTLSTQNSPLALKAYLADIEGLEKEVKQLEPQLANLQNIIPDCTKYFFNGKPTTIYASPTDKTAANKLPDTKENFNGILDEGGNGINGLKDKLEALLKRIKAVRSETLASLHDLEEKGVKISQIETSLIEEARKFLRIEKGVDYDNLSNKIHLGLEPALKNYEETYLPALQNLEIWAENIPSPTANVKSLVSDIIPKDNTINDPKLAKNLIDSAGVSGQSYLQRVKELKTSFYIPTVDWVKSQIAEEQALCKESDTLEKEVDLLTEQTLKPPVKTYQDLLNALKNAPRKPPIRPAALEESSFASSVGNKLLGKLHSMITGGGGLSSNNNNKTAALKSASPTEPESSETLEKLNVSGRTTPPPDSLSSKRTIEGGQMKFEIDHDITKPESSRRNLAAALDNFAFPSTLNPQLVPFLRAGQEFADISFAHVLQHLDSTKHNFTLLAKPLAHNLTVLVDKIKQRSTDFNTAPENTAFRHIVEEGSSQLAETNKSNLGQKKKDSKKSRGLTPSKEIVNWTDEDKTLTRLIVNLDSCKDKLNSIIPSQLDSLREQLLGEMKTLTTRYLEKVGEALPFKTDSGYKEYAAKCLSSKKFSTADSAVTRDTPTIQLPPITFNTRDDLMKYRAIILEANEDIVSLETLLNKIENQVSEVPEFVGLFEEKIKLLRKSMDPRKTYSEKRLKDAELAITSNHRIANAMEQYKSRVDDILVKPPAKSEPSDLEKSKEEASKLLEELEKFKKNILPVSMTTKGLGNDDQMIHKSCSITLPQLTQKFVEQVNGWSKLLKDFVAAPAIPSPSNKLKHESSASSGSTPVKQEGPRIGSLKFKPASHKTEILVDEVSPPPEHHILSKFSEVVVDPGDNKAPVNQFEKLLPPVMDSFLPEDVGKNKERFGVLGVDKGNGSGSTHSHHHKYFRTAGSRDMQHNLIPSIPAEPDSKRAEDLNMSALVQNVLKDCDDAIDELKQAVNKNLQPTTTSSLSENKVVEMRDGDEERDNNIKTKIENSDDILIFGNPPPPSLNKTFSATHSAAADVRTSLNNLVDCKRNLETLMDAIDNPESYAQHFNYHTPDDSENLKKQLSKKFRQLLKIINDRVKEMGGTVDESLLLSHTRDNQGLLLNKLLALKNKFLGRNILPVSSLISHHPSEETSAFNSLTNYIKKFGHQTPKSVSSSTLKHPDSSYLSPWTNIFKTVPTSDILTRQSSSTMNRGLFEGQQPPPPPSDWHEDRFYQVMLASIPFQILLLSILGFACFIPMSNNDYNCLNQNTFLFSMQHPSLTYPLGPPPL